MRRLVCRSLAGLALAACVGGPMGRDQLKFFPEDEMEALGQAGFEQIEAQTPRSRDAEPNALVRCVADAVLRQLPRDERGEWEVVVFEEDSASAFALPGRKLGVHTGLLRATANPGQLAAVLGHVVAHVVAEHANERMSQSFAATRGAQLTDALRGPPSPTRQQVLGLLGVGAPYGVRIPYSRAHESEADALALEIVARAGFDPEESVRFWEPMSRLGVAPQPELLALHPMHETRVRNLRERIPDATAYAQEAVEAGRRPGC